jgi:hypothetical protein
MGRVSKRRGTFWRSEELRAGRRTKLDGKRNVFPAKAV